MSAQEVSTLATVPSIYVRTWDVPNPKATILLVHGLAEHSGRWEHVADYFSKAGYRFVAYDLRGHGHSGGSRVDLQDFDEHLHDLQLMVEKTSTATTPLFIYGHSMGGLIATRYALSNRPQPAGYILSAPCLAANVPKPLRLAAKILGSLTPCLRMKASIKGSQLSSDPEVGRRYFADPLVFLKSTARHGKKLLAAMEETYALVRNFRQPALVFHGAADTLVPPIASEPFVGIPGVIRHVLPGKRHESHNEAGSQELFRMIQSWLEEQTARV